MSDSVSQGEVKSDLPHPAGRGGYLLGLPVAVLVLYVLVSGAQALKCVWLLPIIVVVALPLWRYHTDRILFERRAILATVATPTGSLWRWFWRGRLASTLQVFVSLVLAAALVSVLIPLQRLHWAVLAADASLIALFIPTVRRALAGQVRAGYIGLVARRWPLTFFNILVLIAGFVYVDFAVVGWSDTRELPWATVVERAFKSAQEGTACAVLGTAVGVADAVASLSRHFASLVIPSLPAGSVRVIAWVTFLAWAGFGAFLYTRFLLGIVALLDRVGGTEAGADDRTIRAFVYTILVLAIPFTYAYIKYDDWRARPVPMAESELSKAAPADPCTTFEFDKRSLRARIDEDVQQARAEVRSLGEQRIDAALYHAFGQAEKGVDQYLNWYYSMLGDYSRLAAVVTDDIDEMMSEKLNYYIIEQTGFSTILESSSRNIEQETELLMGRAAEAAGASIENAVQVSPCPVPNVNLAVLMDLRRDRLRATIATAAGGGVTAKLLLTKPAAAIAGKLAAKGSVKLAGKTLAKVGVKKGASALASGTAATVACAGLGPVAIACGIGAGIVTWLTVDKVVLEVDEFVNRDAMRAELMAGLAEQRAELRAQLVALQGGLVELYAAEILSAPDKVFIPSRDGT